MNLRQGMYVINMLLLRCHFSTLMMNEVCVSSVLAHFITVVSNLWIRGPFLSSFLRLDLFLPAHYRCTPLCCICSHSVTNTRRTPVDEGSVRCSDVTKHNTLPGF